LNQLTPGEAKEKVFKENKVGWHRDSTAHTTRARKIAPANLSIKISLERRFLLFQTRNIKDEK